MLKFIRISILCLTMFFSTSLLAQSWWTANANVYYNPTRVSCAVYNGLNRPVFCTGKVEGFTYSGHVVWTQFEAGISPGYYGNAYVYTNPQNPFINADAFIRCRWF